MLHKNFGGLIVEDQRKEVGDQLSVILGGQDISKPLQLRGFGADPRRIGLHFRAALCADTQCGGAGNRSRSLLH